MGSGSRKRDCLSSEAAELLEPEAILDDSNANLDGSNALILPSRKKSKSKEKGKVDKKSKNMEAPRMSKSKLRKLKKLEEEKEKKLLLAKSVELLGKYKIWDGAYSLLHASATIGKAETMKEKRRRAVQFSKAGLEVPDELSVFKKKCNEKVSDDAEAVLRACQQKDVVPEKNKDLHVEEGNCREIDSMEPAEGQHTTDMEVSMSEPVAEERKVDSNMLENQKILSIFSRTFDVSNDMDLQDREVEQKKHSQREAPAVQEHVNPPIVVPVSRPQEVEKTRRDLPIIMMEQEIMEAIIESPVVILCGETGCGKTTQVPQFLYEAGFGSSDRCDRKGIIGVTQPRRVAVLATADRVSFELGLKLGEEVGFQVRHDKMMGSRCSIKFMTDGILLREVQSDFLLKRYSVIILDEAHERSLNTDILIGMLSRIIKIRQALYAEQQEKIRSGVKINPENVISQLKLVLMSATLRVDDFISNRKLFDGIPPVVEVPVRQFPVTIHFSKRTHEDYLGQAYKKVVSINKRLPPGGILVFVTGQREVDFLCKKLQRASRRPTAKNSATTASNKIISTSEVDVDKISEAYDINSNGPEHQDDFFGSYDEGENSTGLNIDSSSDFGTDSEIETDSEDEEAITYEPPEKDGLVLDFLKNAESLSILKASFEAISGRSGEAVSVEKPTPPVPQANEHTKSTAVSSGLHVLPLYAMLPASEQLHVFQDAPQGKRKVVVATNVAETSLTIPGIKYVVDTGKEKVKNCNYSTGMATYEVQWISKASGSQRAGRAGRTGPGHCYRLYSSAAYSKDDLFPEFSFPEILKIPVDGVVLLLKFMGIDKVANFPFPTPPEKEALLEAERCLQALEAFDGQGRLTPMGRTMAQYPMSPRHSRLLLTVIKIMSNQKGYARSNLVLAHAAAAASALSFPNPFLLQFGESNDTDNELRQEDKSDSEVTDQQGKKKQKKIKAMVREARAKFSNPSSDALTIVRALQLFELAENPKNFCRDNSLHWKTMDEMSKLRVQLLHLIFRHSKSCEEFSWNHGSIEDVEHSWRSSSDKKPLLMNEEELMGQAICAGWADRVAKRVRTISGSSKDDQKVRAVRYQSSALNDTVYLHRSSSVAQCAPEFVVYLELLNTKRPYMHGVTSVKPDWLLKYASSLCTFSAPLDDPKPYYEPLSDQVFYYVNPIFGRHNWQLPLHSLPIKEGVLRLQVFASALLKGDVLPCLRTFQNLLALPPSVILGPVSQRRVGDLLNRMKIGSKMIDSRAALRRVWNDDPNFLYPEIQSWFQEKYRDQFREVWGQMHREVLLEGRELFPKRAKKVRR